MQRALFLIYNLLYLLGLLIVLPYEYFRRPSLRRSRWLREKFGIFEGTSPKGNRRTLWIHAVSVGETIAMTRLIQKLSKDYTIVLSTVTDTAQAVATERFRLSDVKVIYMPFDIPFAVAKTLDFFNPEMVVIAETELWPNFIWVCSKRVPVVLVNGRLSEKSLKRYSWVRFFIRPILERLSLICVQEPIYRERFISLGVPEHKVRVTGNLKFDIELKRVDFKWERLIQSPVILAGSTHEGEEELILNVFTEFIKEGTLILAPRHPERFERVKGLIERRISKALEKPTFLRLSELEEIDFSEKQESLPTSKPNHRDSNYSPSKSQTKSLFYSIILVDRIGILGSLYRICDIAIIGGSFIPRGGQNPLEPAYWSKPIICGKYMDNFPFIEEFVSKNAAIMTDREGLKEALLLLIKNQQLRQSIGVRANQLFLTKAGATERTIQALDGVLKAAKDLAFS